MDPLSRLVELQKVDVPYLCATRRGFSSRVSGLASQLIERLDNRSSEYNLNPHRWVSLMESVEGNLENFPVDEQTQLAQKVSAWLWQHFENRVAESKAMTGRGKKQIMSMLTPYLRDSMSEEKYRRLDQAMDGVPKAYGLKMTKEELFGMFALFPFAYHPNVLHDLVHDIEGNPHGFEKLEWKSKEVDALVCAYRLALSHRAWRAENYLARNLLIRFARRVGQLPYGDPERLVEEDLKVISLTSSGAVKTSETSKDVHFARLFRALSRVQNVKAPFGIENGFNEAKKALHQYSEHPQCQEIYLAFLLTPPPFLPLIRKKIEDAGEALNVPQILVKFVRSHSGILERSTEHWTWILKSIGEWKEKNLIARLVRLIGGVAELSLDHPLMELALQGLALDPPASYK